MEDRTVLKLDKINKRFGGIHALQDVSLSLEKGEVHALLGENGAGKSTLIKILTGVIKSDSGTMLLNGREVHVTSPIDARRKGIAAIYQELSLIETLTVAENIFLGNEPTRTPLGLSDNTTLFQRSDEYLKEFNINIDSRALVSSLGMGQKRIVEIVKALAVNAEILLLDEPTTGMSQAEIDILFQIMDTLRKKKVTMLYISHYLDEVFRICDRASVMRDGKNVDTYDVKSVNTEILVKAMIGKSVRSETFRTAQDASKRPVLLELKDFKTPIMRQPVSFTLHENEIIGITGIVGAGKSEIASSIFGNGGRHTGGIFIRGSEVRLRSPHDTKKYKMALIPEDRKSQGLFLSDTVADNTVIANIEQTESSLHLLNSAKKRSITERIGKALELKPLAPELPARNLSGGNQQKVVVGKWLIGTPEIVLMDEPTRGIDVGAKSEIYRLIAKLADENKGLVIFSSDFEELLGLCDRIMVVYKGSIVADLAADEATSEKLLSASVGGTGNGRT